MRNNQLYEAHVAPPGFELEDYSFLYTCRPAGAKKLEIFPDYTHRSLLRKPEKINPSNQ